MSLGLKKKYLMSLVQSGGVSPRLPSAYQEVEYIQSSGNQWIRTGVTEYQKLKTITDFQIVSYGNSAEYAMGAIYSYSGKTIRMEIVEIYQPRDNYFGMGADGQFINTGISVDTNRHIVEIDNVNGYAKFDGSTVQTFTTTTSSINNSTQDVTLFAYNVDGNILTPMSVKIYSSKIWKFGTLVRDFVPCYRKADGEIGLYDLVNNVFYTNQGSGTFTCGVPIIYDSRYQQVEYIEGNGTQYIDTGVVVQTNIKYDIDFQLTSTANSKAFWGENDGLRVCQATTYQGKFYVQYLSSDTVTNTINFTTDLLRHKVYAEPNAQYLDGVKMATGTFSGTAVGNGTFLIFTRTLNGSHNLERIGSMKLYSCKIWISTTLQRELVPCYRKADNEIGLLDIVNDVFYTNQGSGVFTKGSDIIVS